MNTATQKIPTGLPAETLVKAGCKQTDVGIIPEDWNVKNLGELFEITSSKRVFQSEWRSSGVPFYRARELAVLGEKGKVDNELFIEEEMYQKYKSAYGVPVKGDILVTGVGTLGKVYVVVNSHKFYFKDGNIIWFKINKKLDSEFLKQLYLTPFIERQIIKMSAGSTVGTYTITGAKKTTIPFPQKVEQTVIARILSDTDELIEKLERLIVKKKAIKQGAMQELLTGKKRLSGFSGKWETKKLEEVAEIVGGGTPSSSVSKYWNGEINWFTPTEVGNSKYLYGSRRKITEEGFRNSSTKILPEGSILLSSRAGIGDLGILKERACTNQGFQSLVPSFYTNNEFLYYLMQTKQDALLEKASGSTFLEISPNSVRQIKIRVPLKPEQTSIADVLSDVDLEIDYLEKELAKYRQIKTGMMQQLLTGKIRLVN
ncbi:restriction endonuclease subunit S [Patescibacteria group bacterium]|nr:restriction endonuclease subunit S [Patescibacteria group bacterium]